MVMTGIASSGGRHARLFAHVSLITQSPPLVPPLGDLYGNSSRKFMIFCAGASGGEDVS